MKTYNESWTVFAEDKLKTFQNKCLAHVDESLTEKFIQRMIQSELKV
jgi:hypothetical protein